MKDDVVCDGKDFDDSFMIYYDGITTGAGM